MAWGHTLSGCFSLSTLSHYSPRMDRSSTTLFERTSTKQRRSLHQVASTMQASASSGTVGLIVLGSQWMAAELPIRFLVECKAVPDAKAVGATALRAPRRGRLRSDRCAVRALEASLVPLKNKGETAAIFNERRYDITMGTMGSPFQQARFVCRIRNVRHSVPQTGGAGGSSCLLLTMTNGPG